MLDIVNVEYFTEEGIEYKKEIYNNGTTVATPVPQPINLNSNSRSKFMQSQNQLDRIEEAVNKSQQDIIDEYTLELIESGAL